jgi:hypothetical protein
MSEANVRRLRSVVTPKIKFPVARSRVLRIWRNATCVMKNPLRIARCGSALDDRFSVATGQRSEARWLSVGMGFAFEVVNEGRGLA